MDPRTEKTIDELAKDVKQLLVTRLPALENDLAAMKAATKIYGALGGILSGAIVTAVMQLIIHK